MNDHDLKSCPFCGGAAELETGQRYDHLERSEILVWSFVTCKDCGAQVGHEDEFIFEKLTESKQSAVNAWNRRV